jgi:hypothetical protein
VRDALGKWKGGGRDRKVALFDLRVIDIALKNLTNSKLYASGATHA